MHVTEKQRVLYYNGPGQCVNAINKASHNAVQHTASAHTHDTRCNSSHVACAIRFRACYRSASMYANTACSLAHKNHQRTCCVDCNSFKPCTSTHSHTHTYICIMRKYISRWWVGARCANCARIARTLTRSETLCDELRAPKKCIIEIRFA